MDSKKRQLIKAGRREADNILYILTGKRAKQIFTPDNVLLAARKLFTSSEVKEKPLDITDPYYILGVRHDAPMSVVKAAYRTLSWKLHPDTGTESNDAKFKQVQEAYEFIEQERKEMEGNRG